MPDTEFTKVRHHYLGACFLLARLSGRQCLSREDRYLIRQALFDCQQLCLPDFEVVATHDGGVALEPKRSDSS